MDKTFETQEEEEEKKNKNLGGRKKKKMDSIRFNNQCKEIAIRDSCWLKCVCINRKMRQVPPKTKKLSVRFLFFFFFWCFRFY